MEVEVNSDPDGEVNSRSLQILSGLNYLLKAGKKWTSDGLVGTEMRQSIYCGALDVATKIMNSYGARGLYRGLGMSVMTYSPLLASYGSSQRVISRFLGYGGDSDATDAPSKTNIVLVQAAGGINAAATGSAITTPLDTIKTRLQVIGHEEIRPSAKQVVKNLLAEDGWKGFYRGLGPRFFSMSAWELK